jgi:hypothetical protein
VEGSAVKAAGGGAGGAGRAAQRDAGGDASITRTLGIRENTTLALIGAPRGFAGALGALPRGARIVEGTRNECSGPDGPCPVALWFPRSLADLKRGIAGMQGFASRLWVAWPKKTSGVKTDLGESAIRDTGLAAGWVDFKVCSLNATWSALAFTRRR